MPCQFSYSLPRVACAGEPRPAWPPPCFEQPNPSVARGYLAYRCEPAGAHGAGFRCGKNMYALPVVATCPAAYVPRGARLMQFRWNWA